MILQLTEGVITTETVHIAGVVVIAASMAAAAAIVYRWYADERIQEGLAVLIGLATIAIYLNTTAAIGQVIGGGAGLFDLRSAIVNVVTFLLAAGGTLVGRQIGDRLAVEVGVLTGRRELKTDVARLVTTVGRVVAVTLPDDIDDIVGYDPVAPEIKEAMAGKTLLFPRGLTVAELRDRLRSRLADDYGVGHIDVELADDGSVDYLAVGSRAAGLGPTLAPGMAAVAVRADPPFAASSGDVVELWREDPEPEQVAVGELRAAVDDLATVALEEATARDLSSDASYRLVTRPAMPQADREFAGVLGAADETMGAVTVAPDSELIGTPLAETDVAVVAIQPADGKLLAVPARSRPFEPGDVVYAIGRPEALRRLEAAAEAPKPEPSS